jgi:hypothetical protein
MIATPPHLRSVVTQDGAVILDIPHNRMTTLNATGSYVWQCLQRGMSPESIASELSRETGADEAAVARDLNVFLEELQSKHLTVVS